MRTCHARGKHGGRSRFNRNDLYIGLLGFQVFADTRDRTAGADACNEDIHLTIGILIDFRTRGLSVRLGVGGVDELTGDKAVRSRRRKLLRLGCAPPTSFRA